MRLRPVRCPGPFQIKRERAGLIHLKDYGLDVIMFISSGLFMLNQAVLLNEALHVTLV